MASLKLPHRDSLGWLIPVLLFCLFYGLFLWLNEEGLLRQMGVLLCAGGVIGLGFSRRVRRLVRYHALPKTPERREFFTLETSMEAARRRARKEGIPQLITDLYFNYIVHLPSWLHAEKRADDVIIPAQITAATKLPGNRITMTLSGREYIFTFVQYVSSTREGERDIQATLQVASENQKLILIHLMPESEEAVGLFHPISIEYVTMSDWVNEFRHLREVIREEKEVRRHEDRLT